MPTLPELSYLGDTALRKDADDDSDPAAKVDSGIFGTLEPPMAVASLLA